LFKEDSAGRHNYLLDRVSVLAVYDGNNTKRAWYNHNPQRIDEILSQIQPAGKLYHLVDGLGSVYGLVNEGQVKVASYSYDAYGALTSAEVQPGIVNPYLFTGRELDGDSGLQYNRARYYLSGVGIWNGEDPLNMRNTMGISGASSTYNYYGYSCLPTLYIDPSGMFTITGSRGINYTIAGGIGVTWANATVEYNWDLEGNEMYSYTEAYGVTYGYSADVLYYTTALYTNAPTVCDLLGPASYFAFNVTAGLIGFVGVTMFIWKSGPYRGFGVGMLLGAGIQTPINFSFDNMDTFTYLVYGNTCKDNKPCR
jgi:RHS repeat-associated protein